jgi:hypothetical protein
MHQKSTQKDRGVMYMNDLYYDKSGAKGDEKRRNFIPEELLV